MKFLRWSVEAPQSVALPRISARETVGRDSVEPRMKRRFDHASKFILRPLGSLSFWRVSDRLRDASSDLRGLAEFVLSLSKEASLSIGDTLLRPRLFGKIYCRARIRRGGSLAGGLRWQAPHTSRQFFARADRREPYRSGIAQGF